MKNVLILSPDSIFNPMGGLGVHLRELIKNLDTTETKVTIIQQGPTSEITAWNGISIYGIETTTRSDDAYIISARYQTVFMSQAIKLIESGEMNRPDIVHILDWSTATAGMEIADIYGAKIVFAVHLSLNNYINVKDVALSQYYNHTHFCDIELEVCAKADKIVQVTNSYANKLPFYLYKGKTEIVYNGVDVEEFKNAKPYKLKGENPIKIVYIGRFSEMKNIESLLAMSLPDNCDLSFIGGKAGSDRLLYERVTALNSIESNMYYEGYLTGEDKAAAIAAADLVLMPSIHEPFGLVALEALAAGQNDKTILATSFVDGLGEFLNTDVALNCGVTTESIEICIEEFLNTPKDKRTDMCKEGVKLAESLSWKTMADKISKIWLKID